MAYKVFISSSVKDIDLARDLSRRLKEAGIDVYSVDKAAVPGEANFNKITVDLGRADEVLLILTDNSVDNPNLMYELGAATSLRKRVTPVIVGLEPNKLPSLMKGMNFVKYTDLPKYISDLEKRVKAA
ncbi:MAG TPA: toll/interleukin-1 receptor domain-containing protein [Pyrinomonadaceae bacterium]|jgi:hypothetical protein